MTDLILDSLRRRMRVMHSLWEDAVATMDLDQVNFVEREPVLPIAFSLFHFVQIEDGSATMLGAGPMVYDDAWAERMGLTIADHGKHKTVDEMVGQRIGDYDAFKEYMRLVFDKTESWLATLDPAELTEVVVARPFPPMIVTTFSARVAGDVGITRLDATECWIYQHGLRHMGEIEHARALVGLQGMTS
ncbi:MAG: DinB family protein [Acidimicrobiales bacterium]